MPTIDWSENSFFMPESGFSRENFGLSAFIVKSPRVCATVGIIPRSIAIKHIGSTAITTTVKTSTKMDIIVSVVTSVVPICSNTEPV